MRIIDILVDTILDSLSTPAQMKEVLYLLLMELSLRSESISERKAWEVIASLVSLTFSIRRFPSPEELVTIRKNVNKAHRLDEKRTSLIFETLKMYELGEAAVKKFLHSKAWKGMPGFEEDGTPLP